MMGRWPIRSRVSMPSTRRHPVQPRSRADSSIIEEIQALCGHKTHATEMQHCYAASKVDNANAVPSYWIRQARHAHPMKERETRKTKETTTKQFEKKRSSVYLSAATRTAAVLYARANLSSENRPLVLIASRRSQRNITGGQS